MKFKFVVICFDCCDVVIATAIEVDEDSVESVDVSSKRVVDVDEVVGDFDFAQVEERNSKNSFDEDIESVTLNAQRNEKIIYKKLISRNRVFSNSTSISRIVEFFFRIE